MSEGRILASATHEHVAATLIANGGSAYALFNGLGLGWNADDVRTYLDGVPTWEMLVEADIAGPVLGMVLAFATLCVEQDRSRRQPSRR